MDWRGGLGRNGSSAPRRILFALILNTVSICAHGAPSFGACAERVRAQPSAYESYRCYYEVAASDGDWKTAVKHLTALSAAHPQVDWIVLVRALAVWPLNNEEAERLFLEAARRFEAAGNIRGEVLARANLHTLYRDSGRLGQAAKEVERVTALGERAEEPEVRIRARVVESEFFISMGTNFGRAQRSLQQAEAELDKEPAYWLKEHVLYGLGTVLVLTGQYNQAVTYFRRLSEEANTQQDLTTAARAQLSIVNALVEKRSEEPYAVDAERLFADAEGALVTARRAQDLDLELSALRILGEVLMLERPERARAYINTCIERAEKNKRSQSLSECLWIQGRLVAANDPIAAQQAIDRAIDLLEHQEGNDYELLAYAWRHAMRVAWQTQSPDIAIARGKQALIAIERVRNLQPGLESRAAAFSTWTQDYYWLSGQILRLATDSTTGVDGTGGFGQQRASALMDEAFQVGERMRSRSLLDRLRAPPRPLTELDDATLQRREELLKSIVNVNQQLLKSKGQNNADLLLRLEALERQEIDAREAQGHPHVAINPVSLSEVQRTLQPHEALLSFQIGLREGSTDRFAGGSWLFAVTRDEVRVFALPDRYSLTQSLALFKGLMGQSPAQLTRAGLALYNQMFKQALDALPERIDRLIVVPDSPLDTFPLAALSDSSAYTPLAGRYELVLVASATIWHDWRTSAGGPGTRPALVLADPQLDFTTTSLSSWRSGLQEMGLSLGQLPHARAEGREVIDRLQGRGTLWSGAEASEAALKGSDLSRYGILHFATHTVVDSANAERSAILLASGAANQDGLLQSREIADLHLGGHVVVLSSCQSAMGTQVRGEGVLGLARSFFAAGARTVVGSLWPIRDDHAQAFFDPFYAALGKGSTVGAAFREAQRRLIEKGLPMEAWAGFVLMGDPGVTPVSRAGVGERSYVVVVWVAAVAVALVLILRRIRVSPP